ncbi:MAG: hypothetical protein QM778_11190 [Myxococcales bacterium]
MVSSFARTLTIVGLVGLTGCSSKPPRESAREPAKTDAGKAEAPNGGKKPDSALTPEFRGTLHGIVKLAPGAQLPLAAVPSKADVVAAKECPPISDSDRRQVTENETSHGLTPLHVALTGMTSAPPRAPVTHELELRDCRLMPTMIAAMTGDKLHVVSHSKIPFLPQLPGETFMQALLPETEREVDIKGIGPITIKCGLGSYCGESVLLSTAHSLYDITDSEGRFSITGVPLDQDLTVHAWHPLFKPTSATFRLSQDERSKDVELVIEPLVSVDAGVASGAEPAAPAKQARKKKPAP